MTSVHLIWSVSLVLVLVSFLQSLSELDRDYLFVEICVSLQFLLQGFLGLLSLQS